MKHNIALKLKLLPSLVLLLSLAAGAFAQTDAELKALATQFPAMPRGTAGLIPFVGGLPTFSSGTPFNDLLYTLIDPDYIDGENGGYDTSCRSIRGMLFPAPTRSRSCVAP